MKKYIILLLALVLVVVIGFFVFNRFPYDNCGGDQCPKCKSTHVGRFFYGLYVPEREDSVTLERVKKGILIPGGCMIDKDSPRFRCNDCHFTWGKYISRR